MAHNAAQELPGILKEDLTAHFAHTYDDVYAVAFGSDIEVAQLAEMRAPEAS